MPRVSTRMRSDFFYLVLLLFRQRLGVFSHTHTQKVSGCMLFSIPLTIGPSGANLTELLGTTIVRVCVSVCVCVCVCVCVSVCVCVCLSACVQAVDKQTENSRYQLQTTTGIAEDDTGVCVCILPPPSVCITGYLCVLVCVCVCVCLRACVCVSV